MINLMPYRKCCRTHQLTVNRTCKKADLISDKTYGYISCLMYVLAGLFSWIVSAVISI